MDVAENGSRAGGAAGSIKSTEAMPKSGSEATKRLQKELMDLMLSGASGISAFPEGDNLFRSVSVSIFSTQ